MPGQCTWEVDTAQRDCIAGSGGIVGKGNGEGRSRPVGLVSHTVDPDLWPPHPT